MFNELFINALLLISFTFIVEHVQMEFLENLMNKFWGKVILGTGGGVLGILMLVYTIRVVGTNTLLDLRILAILVISSIGGLIPTVISGFIITLYRIGYFGINQSSILALIQTCLCIAIFYIIDKKIENSWKNWFTKLATSLVILISTYLYLLKDVGNSYVILFNFALAVICVGTLEYFLLNYSKRSNELYKMYKKDSTKDFLTGLNNTRNFDNLLNMSFNQAKENNYTISCLMVDIDHFKRVNDTYGHPIGDIVLKELANILMRNCRTFDIIGRVGGEEFCILLLDCSVTHSFEIGMRIRNAVKEYKFPIGDNKYISITVSIGVATYPDTASNLEELKEKADTALYIAKQTGRDKVCDNHRCIIR